MFGGYEVWACMRQRLGSPAERWFLSKTFTSRNKANAYAMTMANAGYATRIKFERHARAS